MTIIQKLNLYEYDTVQQRLAAWYELTKAAYQGKDLAKIQLVFDRWGGVTTLEKKS